MKSKKHDGLFEFNNEAGVWSKHLIWIRDSVTDIATTLNPDEDPMPVVFVDSLSMPGDVPGAISGEKKMPDDQVGKPGMLIIAVGGLMRDDETKDYLAYLMAATAIKANAKGMTFLSTVWMSEWKGSSSTWKEDPGESEEKLNERMLAESRAHIQKHGQPSEDPNRREKLMLLSIYCEGEDDGIKIAFADVVRSKDKPPSFADWVIMDDGSTGSIGRFPEAIYMGLKIARELRESKSNEGEEWKEGK